MAPRLALSAVRRANGVATAPSWMAPTAAVLCVVPGLTRRNYHPAVRAYLKAGIRGLLVRPEHDRSTLPIVTDVDVAHDHGRAVLDAEWQVVVAHGADRSFDRLVEAAHHLVYLALALLAAVA